MRKVYRCPNHCTVSDEKRRCPRCGQWLLYDGKHEDQEIIKKSEELGRSTIPSYVR